MNPFQTERVYGFIQRFSSRLDNEPPLNESNTEIPINKEFKENYSFEYTNPTLPYELNTLAKNVHEYQGSMQKRLLKKYLNEKGKVLLNNGIKGDSYLYKRMNKDYILNVKLPELEKHYQYLAERRKLFIPIRFQNIRKHEETYNNGLKSKANSYTKEEHNKFRNELIKRTSIKTINENYKKRELYSKIINDSYFPNIQKKAAKNFSHTPIKKLKFAELSPEMKELAKKYNIKIEEPSRTSFHKQKSVEIRYKNGVKENSPLITKQKNPYDCINIIRTRLSLLEP